MLEMLSEGPALRRNRAIPLIWRHTIIQLEQGSTCCGCNIQGVLNLYIIRRGEISFKTRTNLPVDCFETLLYDYLNLTTVFFYYGQIIFLQPVQVARDSSRSSLDRFLISRCGGETARQFPEKGHALTRPILNQSIKTHLASYILKNFVRSYHPRMCLFLNDT